MVGPHNQSEEVQLGGKPMDEPSNSYLIRSLGQTSIAKQSLSCGRGGMDTAEKNMNPYFTTNSFTTWSKFISPLNIYYMHQS